MSVFISSYFPLLVLSSYFGFISWYLVNILREISGGVKETYILSSCIFENIFLLLCQIDNNFPEFIGNNLISTYFYRHFFITSWYSLLWKEGLRKANLFSSVNSFLFLRLANSFLWRFLIANIFIAVDYFGSNILNTHLIRWSILFAKSRIFSFIITLAFFPQ